MQRTALLDVLDGFKARNGGVNDFRISVSASEARSVLMTLVYFRAEGIISEYYRLAEPYECCYDIEGYTN